MAASYDPDALWVKARLFLNHAMDDAEPRTFDERALWAALALELLAKAALAKVSPLLIASPTEDGSNLLMASGLIDGDARFSSVAAHTLWSRCHRAFKPFSEREARLITDARNEYLHGAGVGFTGIPPEAWWPRYWAQAAILVSAFDSDIDGLVGSSRVAVVEAHLAQNKKNIEHRVEMLIEHARQRLALHRAGSLTARVAEQWARATDMSAGLAHRTEQSCPACGGTGTLEGENVREAEVHYERVSEEDFDAWVDLTIDADYFGCPTCHLVLDGYELLAQAGLPQEFAATGDIGDYDGPDYGND